MGRGAVMLGLGLLGGMLGACSLPESLQPSDAYLKRGYARIAPPRPDTPAVYCYKTLADPECIPIVLAGEEYRLVSYYGPAPYVIHVPAAPQIIWQD